MIRKRVEKFHSFLLTEKSIHGRIKKLERRNMMTVVRQIALCIDALKNVDNPSPWATGYLDKIFDIEKNFLPSGSRIDLKASTREKIVIDFGYHCMDGNGYYSGWMYYTLTVKPSFVNLLSLKIEGQDYNGNIDYFCDIFYDALLKELP